MLLQDLLQSESLTTAAPRLRRGAAVYAPTFFAPYVLAGLIAAEGGGRLVVAPDAEAAAALAAELGVYLEREVPVLPARGVLYGADVAPAPHVVGQRQQALAALGAGGVVVADCVAALERFLPLDLQPEPLSLVVGEETPFDLTVERLVALGYGRVEQVRGRGEFAVRGGLVDVYPSIGEPLRVEFWGDEVERLRTFSVYSQRTAAEVAEATVYAAFEADTAGDDFQGAVRQVEAAWEDEGRDEAPDDVVRRAEVRALAGLAGRFTTLAECAAGAGLSLIVLRPDETWRALADFAAEVDLVFGAPTRERGGAAGAATGAPPAARDRLYVPLPETRALLARGLQLEVVRREQAIELAASRPQFAARDLGGAERDLARLVNDGYRVYVVFRHDGEAQRAAYRLRHLTAEVLEAGEAGRAEPAAPGLYFLAAPLREGFVSADLKLAVIPERSLLRGPSRERRFVGGTRLASFFDVRPGDYVVHEDHGIARFAGVETRTVAGITRDYLLLQFRGDDRVFVPHEQIGKVSRYIGAGAGAPPLNKLGGTAWLAVKTRARKAVVEMAGELLQLYASRQAVPGFAYPADGDLTRRLEESFPFEETEDQAEAIDEVKNDMEAPHPMDRLVCGDVGYGKTEVALRAAFKAAEGGKQTLVLVPTTILAQQHAVTFAERYEDLPVEIGMVSRFRTKAEQRDVLTRFEKGDVDVLIGTHRLLSTDVRPKDLGLVVVDEEQRFGVRQKELLRHLKLQTDVLSMSATPIPRTLQMSLSGIRDISVIETPPRGRHEVRTYIGEYRDDLVRAAIEKELARGGQVFYLHNRVETIEEAAEHVQELAPKARLLVAHGQLHERALEKVMLAFLAGEADVLVTTSIIESGIDIPSANTLIVERADMLGLAQLYQIRGRIGRSDAYAYAYLLYPSEEMLTTEAAARLTTLSDHTELGAGFRIAMADLEIRGAGNLLGDEQSGHVAAVGFEMYAQMLEEAVAELRGEHLAGLAPVRLDVPVTAYVPPGYIAYEATKVDAHRRIARAATLGELGDVRAELADRFGPPPGPVENLLALQAVRIKAGDLGLRAVTLRGARLQLDGLELDSDGAARLRAALPRAVYLAQRAALTVHGDGAAPAADDELNERSQALMWVEQVLDAILDARTTADLSSDSGSHNS
ncbi:MAG: transcription-repair coupling factor [Thermoleophilia bacterium]|nr:transcription-repair coupling factor [Thermoleophilia bacterium]